MNGNRLKKIAFDRRLDVLEMVYASKSGHIGGSMSCMDILTALYYALMDVDKIIARAADRDRFVLSKGHCAEALYAVLADKGFFDRRELVSFGVFDTRLAGHPTPKVSGVEAATGALGHGLPIGVGMAIGLGDTDARVFVLMGDGELAEGSIWEAAMAAAKYKLNNLTAIIDRNGLQISGETETVMPLGDLAAKFSAFGWIVRRCNGHEPDEIIREITANRPTDKPLVLIADTIKGYGGTIMENNLKWHHGVPSADQYREIKADLQRRRDELG